MVWALGGADDLDINGISQLNDRPTRAIQVRDGWTEYGGDAGGNARLGTKPGDFLVTFALPDQ